MPVTVPRVPVTITGETDISWITECGSPTCHRRIDFPKRTGRPVDYQDPKSLVVWRDEPLPEWAHFCSQEHLPGYRDIPAGAVRQ